MTATIANPIQDTQPTVSWWERLTTPTTIRPDISIRSARLVSGLALTYSTIAIFFGIVSSILLFPDTFLQQGTFWAGIIATITLLSAYAVNQRGYYYTGSILLTGTVITCAYLATTDYRYNASQWAVHGITCSAVLLASVLFPQRRAVTITAAAIVILTFLLPLWQPPFDLSASIYPLATVGVLFYFTFLFGHHRNLLEKDRQESLMSALHSAERLAAIVENTSDMVSSMSPTGELFYLNAAGRRLLGLKPDADTGKMTAAQIYPAWVNALHQEEGIPTALKNGTWTHESAVLDSSGHEIPVLQTIIAHKSDDGEIDYLSTIIRDISEQKRVAAEREALIKDLIAAKRLAEENSRLKSEFLSTISHELRTPLNAIEGFTSVVLKRMGGADCNAKAEDYLTRVQSNSKRLLQLINDFLDLSRIESGRLELVNQPFAPVELAKRWYQEISVLADKKGLHFELKVDSALPDTLFGDEDAISKVATNLLSNAIKFTEQGSITLAIDCNDETWSIAVTDTGIGIPPHAHDFIFEEFRQVDQSSKRKFGGTGLGLAIVQKYTRSMGGVINLQSEQGKGSVFTITLPLTITA